MKLSEFDYEIPEKQIAQSPLAERDASRLLILMRESGKITHTLFRDLSSYLRKGDILVLNNTKVIPSRLYGLKPSGGKAEITLLNELSTNLWTALTRNIHEGKVLITNGIRADVARFNGTLARVTFDMSDAYSSDIKDCLHTIGSMPLPVYVKREATALDLDRYQTVYARRAGAVAAPTAGLHFTENLLKTLRHAGIECHFVTLHVGYGTFKPVTAMHIKDHKMDREYFEIPTETANAINRARSEKRRVVAVGTTVTRAIEGAAHSSSNGLLPAGKGVTSLFISPGYEFRIVKAIITNFHLPKSTPMILVSAFTGVQALKDTYTIAQSDGYRFYSYGDAMLIL